MGLEGPRSFDYLEPEALGLFPDKFFLFCYLFKVRRLLSLPEELPRSDADGHLLPIDALWQLLVAYR